MKPKWKWETRKVQGYVCGIAAHHELGNTHVVVYPSKKALDKAHGFCDERAVPLTITFKVKRYFLPVIRRKQSKTV